MNYRRADIADLSLVVATALEFFRELPENVGKEQLTLDGAPLSPELWKFVLRFVSAPQFLTILGEEDGKVKVLFVAEAVLNEWNNTLGARDQLLYVTPDARDGSWVRDGLPLVDEWAKEMHITQLVVTPTKSKNNTVFAEFLSQHGFVPMGTILKKTYE